MSDLPEPGIEPMSSTLAGRFLTTGPSRKSLHFILLNFADTAFFFFHELKVYSNPALGTSVGAVFQLTLFTVCVRILVILTVFLTFSS